MTLDCILSSAIKGHFCSLLKSNFTFLFLSFSDTVAGSSHRFYERPKTETTVLSLYQALHRRVFWTFGLILPLRKIGVYFLIGLYLLFTVTV